MRLKGVRAVHGVVVVLVTIVVSDSFRSHGLWPTRLLCPWDSPSKNTGVGCHFLLQGIFPTQGLNERLLHWQVDSLPQNHLENPSIPIEGINICPH